MAEQRYTHNQAFKSTAMSLIQTEGPNAQWGIGHVCMTGLLLFELPTDLTENEEC